jgi:hypothetical protein
MQNGAARRTLIFHQVWEHFVFLWHEGNFTPLHIKGNHSSTHTRKNTELHAREAMRDRLQNRLHQCDGKTRCPRTIAPLESRLVYWAGSL